MTSIRQNLIYAFFLMRQILQWIQKQIHHILNIAFSTQFSHIVEVGFV